MNEDMIERCCRKLVIVGKKLGGYITFQAISDLFHAMESDVSIEAIDRVYECLKANCIELVDKLPRDCLANNISLNPMEILCDDLKKKKLKPERKSKRHNSPWDRDRNPLDSIANVDDELNDNIRIQDEKFHFLKSHGVQILIQYIGRIKQLSASEERKLAELAKRGDREAVSRLIEANLKHVFNQATNYVGMGLDFLDLFQEGCIGLIKALEKFDWRRGIRLSTFSSWWIFQTINRAIDDYGRVIRLPSYLMEVIISRKP